MMLTLIRDSLCYSYTAVGYEIYVNWKRRDHGKVRREEEVEKVLNFFDLRIKLSDVSVTGVKSN